MNQHSTSTARLWALALVVVVLSPAPRIVHLSDASTTGAEATASAAASVSFERRQRHHHHRSHHHRNAGAAYTGPPRRPLSWCPHCRLQPPPQPPPLQEGEVDPRYDVEKRLVPTGPNPLHN